MGDEDVVPVCAFVSGIATGIDELVASITEAEAMLSDVPTGLVEILKRLSLECKCRRKELDIISLRNKK